MNHFSYQEVKFLLRETRNFYIKKKGVKCSPSAIHGVNKIKENLFNLKKFL